MRNLVLILSMLLSPLQSLAAPAPSGPAPPAVASARGPAASDSPRSFFSHPLAAQAQRLADHGGRIAPSRNSGPALHAAGRGNPWINLLDSQNLSTDYIGPPTLIQSLEEDQAPPLSLATADFDEDGVPDLVSGCTGPDGSILALHRGNVDSIYPNSFEAQKRKTGGSASERIFVNSRSPQLLRHVCPSIYGGA